MVILGIQVLQEQQALQDQQDYKVKLALKVILIM
jgi:hypothetical protein